LNAVSAANPLGLRDGFCSTTIGKPSVQRCEVNTQPMCVPVNYGWILEVFAQDKVRLKEVPV
jgi:hypothetical protein